MVERSFVNSTFFITGQQLRSGDTFPFDKSVFVPDAILNAESYQINLTVSMKVTVQKFAFIISAFSLKQNPQ
jgi:hypothetical protein